MNLYEIGAGVDPEAPDRIEQCAAADHLARALGEMDEQRILARQQVDGSPGTLGAALDAVDHEVADPDPVVGRAGERS